MTQGDVLFSNTTTISTTTVPVSSTQPDEDSKQRPINDKEPSLTDTLAAVTIAVLAVVLVITFTLIVRAIKRRRRMERGQELNYIPTVSAGILSANAAAYRGRNSAPPEQGVISWEQVTPSTSTSDIVASPSVSGVPSSC